MSSQGKNVLITGASSGIGAALAREFAKRGANLILLARRTERLHSLAAELQGAGSHVTCFACDVSKPEDLSHVVTVARRDLGSLDVVIANAGFGVVGSATDLSEADFRRQFETNVFGVMRTLWATVGDLKKSKGRFAVVGSVNGYLALPGNSPYAMSKFAVRAWCDSLRGELAPFGVSVTHIAPGFVKSEIRQVDNMGLHHPGSRDRVPSWIQMPAETAARQIANAIERRKTERIVTVHGKLVVWLVRFVPGFVSFLIRRFGVTARTEP